MLKYRTNCVFHIDFMWNATLIPGWWCIYTGWHLSFALECKYPLKSRCIQHWTPHYFMKGT